MRILLTLVIVSGALLAQEDVADVPNRKVELGDGLDCFVIGERTKAPEGGYGVLVVMPGGSGGADFNAFVKRIWKNAVPRGYLAVQLVSRTWQEGQKIIWPTAKSRVPGMKKSTEEHLEAALKSLEKSKLKLDPKRIFTLSWSSGGPAAYQISVTNKRVRGSFVAMSVFKPDTMASLKNAKKHAYYIYHSRTDDRCPFADAEKAAKELGKKGAEVELVEYEGGHSWGRTVYPDIRAGIAWLEKKSKR